MRSETRTWGAAHLEKVVGRTGLPVGADFDLINQSHRPPSGWGENVVSLASFNGNTRWFAFSGILVEYDAHKSVLTSASLVTSSDDENTIVDNLQIEVRLPNGQCVKGTLQYCNLHYNIAVVNNMVFPHFCAANLYHPKEIQTASEAGIGGPVVNFSGNFIGMNFYDEEETPFLPRNEILECLKQFETQGIMAAKSTTKRKRSQSRCFLTHFT
ncbi:hypothetical protein U9M48_026992 [Paspalum notatum var. saurae]|uniref:Uncharacterized protein n=1 Tax=Paspalum notatum var. saurae TaxID=547442 RepID=A0AAQ3TYK3_PASNO